MNIVNTVHSLVMKGAMHVHSLCLSSAHTYHISNICLNAIQLMEYIHPVPVLRPLARSLSPTVGVLGVVKAGRTISRYMIGRKFQQEHEIDFVCKLTSRIGRVAFNVTYIAHWLVNMELVQRSILPNMPGLVVVAASASLVRHIRGIAFNGMKRRDIVEWIKLAMNVNMLALAIVRSNPIVTISMVLVSSIGPMAKSIIRADRYMRKNSFLCV